MILLARITRAAQTCYAELLFQNTKGVDSVEGSGARRDSHVSNYLGVIMMPVQLPEYTNVLQINV